MSKPSQSGLIIEKEVDRLLLDGFLPASTVVNEALDIVQFRGSTGRCLEPAAGEPTFSLSKMVREGLLIDLRDALIQAKRKRQIIRKQGVRIKSDDDAHEIDLEVISVRGQTAADNFYIIVFGETLNDGGGPRQARGQEACRKTTRFTQD